MRIPEGAGQDLRDRKLDGKVVDAEALRKVLLKEGVPIEAKLLLIALALAEDNRLPGAFLANRILTRVSGEMLSAETFLRRTQKGLLTSKGIKSIAADPEHPEVKALLPKDPAPAAKAKPKAKAAKDD